MQQQGQSCKSGGPVKTRTARGGGPRKLLSKMVQSRKGVVRLRKKSRTRLRGGQMRPRISGTRTLQRIRAILSGKASPMGEGCKLKKDTPEAALQPKAAPPKSQPTARASHLLRSSALFGFTLLVSGEAEKQKPEKQDEPPPPEDEEQGVYFLMGGRGSLRGPMTRRNPRFIPLDEAI